jgi:hypothetical protein
VSVIGRVEDRKPHRRSSRWRCVLLDDRDLKRRVALKTIRDGGKWGAEPERRFVDKCRVPVLGGLPR